MNGYLTHSNPLLIGLSVLLFLTACSSQPYSEQAIKPISNPSDLTSLNENLNKPFITHPQPNNYSICLHNTCSDIAFVSLSDKQWQTIESLFFQKVILQSKNDNTSNKQLHYLKHIPANKQVQIKIVPKII